MRTFLCTLMLLVSVSACSVADDKPGKANAKKLSIGDPAPPITSAKWLRGNEIKSFEPGKVYIVDFWATWCGPCISSMPHMDGFAKEYKDQGLTLLAFTTADENGNDLASVEKFLAGKGSKYSFDVAFSKSQETYNAYMTAAGQDGIPCSYVIDKQGKIAYIGHPMELDDILPMVIAGTWKGTESLKEIEKLNESYEKILGKIQASAQKAEKDAEGKPEKEVEASVRTAVAATATAILPEIEAFGKANPSRAKKEIFQVQYMATMMQAGKFDDAKAIAEKMLADGVAKKSSSTLGFVSRLWANKNLNPDMKHIALAVKATDENLKLDEPDLNVLVNAAIVYYSAGEKDKAKAAGDKALKLAEGNEALTKQIQKVLKDAQE